MNTTTANIWRVITPASFYREDMAENIRQIRFGSGKNYKNSRHTLTRADSQSCIMLQKPGSGTTQATWSVLCSPSPLQARGSFSLTL